MRKGYTVRSNLLCNREARRSVKARIRENLFGVYRPLSPESAEDVLGVLTLAKLDIAQEFRYEDALPIPAVKLSDDIGATYVEIRQVRRAMKDASLRNLEMGRLQEKIDEYNELTPGVDISIDGFSWFGGNERKLAGYILPETEGALEEDVERIGEILQYAGAAALDVEPPNHVSLCSFRPPKNNYAAYQQREAIGRIVRTRFEQAGIESVTLGGVVAGPSYTQAFPVTQMAA